MHDEESAARAGLEKIQATWAGHLFSALIVAGLTWLMLDQQWVPPSGELQGDRWWLLIAAPMVPAWLVIRHMRDKEKAYGRGEASARELFKAYFFSWILTDLPVMIAAPLALFSGDLSFMIVGLLVGWSMMVVARPALTKPA